VGLRKVDGDWPVAYPQRISPAKSDLIHRIGELLEGVITSAAV
jgi:hypothetical protein